MNYSNLAMQWPRRVALLILAATVAPLVAASPKNDGRAVAELDRAFQAAVKQNDARMMAKILHPRMVLILGDGRVNTRAEQLAEARDKVILYEIQDEEPGTQTVRVQGNTAVVTAELRIKGKSAGEAFDRTLWFSDVYVRTGAGWKYFFGQASLALPGSATARLR